MYQYLYAIVKQLPRRWRPPPSGVGGGAVGARAVDSLTVVTSLVDALPRSGPKAWALHHDVVATTIEADALLPLRFGTVIPPEDFEAWLETHHGLIQSTLAQLRGCVEMNVKLLRLDFGSGSRTAWPRGDEAAHSPATPIRVLAERLVDRAGLEHWRYRPVESRSNVAASVAFLVPRYDVPAFLTRITPIASHAARVAIVPTGPWPAYSFVPSFDHPAAPAHGEAEVAARLIERRAG